ncbi:MAG: AAA family ATPase [Alphaproteobacteria bacterium]|nr:AAA family ATPase [Alphaproteobacteria bacterium]
MTYCIVIGNEKGGSGKSTTAMHVAVALLSLKYKVACVDVDAQQGTLTRYIENRSKTKDKNGQPLLMPSSYILETSKADMVSKAHEEEERTAESFMNDTLKKYDFVVIDTPGYNQHLSRIVHKWADTLITPLNDSFVDMDVIARIDRKTLDMTQPSAYAGWVWEMKKQCAVRTGKMLDWVVMRNRLSTLYDRNKGAMGKALQSLSKRLGFRVVEGFSERVIFKEFFLQGLTLFDLKVMGYPTRISHIAAKAELYALLRAIKLEELQQLVSKDV